MSDYVQQPPAGLTALKYAQDILSGTIVSCSYVKLACKRFLDDLEHQKEKGIYFDSEAADRVVRFFGFLKHTKGAWARNAETAGFVLAPWQIFILANLFGWKYIATGERRYREAHIEVARKNGKSTFMAGIGLYMLLEDNEPGAEVYSAATTKEQAQIVWRAAKDMVKVSAHLAARIGVWRSNLHVDKTTSKFEALAADAKTLDGLNIHCALIDELHEHPNRELYDVLNTATGSRTQPGIYAITTAGFDRESICWEQRDYGIKILRGTIKGIQEDKFFVFIATLDDGDNWMDEKNWIKANPNLGVSVSLEALRPNFAKAKEQPSALNEFLRKHMNVWTSADTSWLVAGAWEKNTAFDEHADPLQLREDALKVLRGRRCFGGLDLAECEDFCAFVLVFPPCERVVVKRKPTVTDDPNLMWIMLRSTGTTKAVERHVAEKLLQSGAAVRASKIKVPQPEEVEEVIQEADDKWSIVPFFWIPDAFIEQKEKKNRAPYTSWIRSGMVKSTPGNSVAQEAIREKVLELRQDYRLIEVGYDKFGAEWIGPKLLADGVPMVAVPQRFEFMSNPTKLLSSLINSGQVEHYNNSPLRWHASNVQLLLDHSGNCRPDKGKSRNKIDGIVATVIAVNRIQANPQKNPDDPEKYMVRYI
jgi:phage terminase large subunit-like protein